MILVFDTASITHASTFFFNQYCKFCLMFKRSNFSFGNSKFTISDGHLILEEINNLLMLRSGGNFKEVLW